MRGRWDDSTAHADDPQLRAQSCVTDRLVAFETVPA